MLGKLFDLPTRNHFIHPAKQAVSVNECPRESMIHATLEGRKWRWENHEAQDLPKLFQKAWGNVSPPLQLCSNTPWSALWRPSHGP